MLTDPPTDPDVSKGYLDLLGTGSDEESSSAKNTGVIQVMWTSPVVATIYDTQQAVLRRVVRVLQPPTQWLNIPAGGVVVDVGCDPSAALDEIAWVLKPGGRLAVMVPAAGRAALLWRVLPNGGAYVFGEDEIGDILEDRGFATVRTKNVGTFQWVRAKRGHAD